MVFPSVRPSDGWMGDYPSSLPALKSEGWLWADLYTHSREGKENDVQKHKHFAEKAERKRHR